MRGESERQATLMLGLTPDGVVSNDYPVRRPKRLIDSPLRCMSPQLGVLYAAGGRPSNLPHHLPWGESADSLRMDPENAVENTMSDSEQDLASLLRATVDESQATLLRGKGRTLPLAALGRNLIDSGDDFAPTLPLVQLDIPNAVDQRLTEHLTSLLAEHLQDGLFGHALRSFPTGGEAISPYAFVDTAAKAAAILGADATSRLLHEWASGGLVAYRHHLLISGATIERPIGLEGITIERFDATSPAFATHLPRSIRWERAPGALEEVLLVSVDCVAGPVFHKPESPFGIPPVDSPIGAIEFHWSPQRFCKALSVATKAPISCVGHWLECDRFRAFGWFQDAAVAVLELPKRRVPASLSQPQLQQAVELHRRWTNEWVLPPGVGVAIDRWIGSLNTSDYADALIDLRIALESLYVNDDMSELGFRLAVRGAWHLGRDFRERKEIREVLMGAYRQGSRAVHSGSVDHKKFDYEQMKKAQDLCHRGIITMLHEDRRSELDDLILGKELDQHLRDRLAGT